MALRIASNFPDLFFHMGYQGIKIPRWTRRIFVKSEYHRAWHSGYYGGGILSVMERFEMQ